MSSYRFFVSYLKVSTKKQGEGELGLEAQRRAVADYLRRQPENHLVTEYVEIESGKRSGRRQLRSAIIACKRHKATLIIAKLDRLAGNAAFIANLMGSRVEFVAVDNPLATRLLTHVLAALAELQEPQ